MLLSLRHHRFRFGLLLLGIGCVAGCAEEWGPTPKVVVDVKGRIRRYGRPVGGGWVEFVPLSGAIGDVRSAPLARDGTFHATGVARGTNVIRIVNPPKAANVETVFQTFYSPIRPVIDGRAPLDLDLVTEATRARRSSAPTAR
jgi:hypothetical protein